jgi:exopolysaccharide production protein ExoY
MSQMPIGLKVPETEEIALENAIENDCLTGAWGINGPAKRVLDLIMATLALIALAPLMILTALAVMLDGSSAFYVQSRVGRGGKHFRMFKFRTMRPDADKVLQDLLDSCAFTRAEWEQFQKLRRDPRVTLIGRFLRMSSIDELPQLFNVIKGDMSIVGQRPILPHQREGYGVHIAGYELARPGITGLWQVRGRNRLSFERRAEIGTEYVRTWSLGLDFRIILMTIPALIFSSGAY